MKFLVFFLFSMYASFVLAQRKTPYAMVDTEQGQRSDQFGPNKGPNINSRAQRNHGRDSKGPQSNNPLPLATMQDSITNHEI